MRINLFLISLILSALVHVVFLVTASVNYFVTDKEEVEIEWTVLSTTQTEPQPEQEIGPEPVVERSIFAEPNVAELDEPEDQIVIKEEYQQAQTDSLEEERPFDLFLNDKLALSRQNIQLDSLRGDSKAPVSQNLPPLPKSFSQPGVGDGIDRDIYERNFGHQQPVPMSSLLLKGAKYLKDKLIKEKPPELNFIPTTLQLAAFNAIWENGSATDKDIYSALDTTIRTTSQDLNAELARLEGLGILSREIVSPQQQFMIMTPLGAKGIEMSPTNLRNRIYEYKMHIPKDQVVRFLNAALYQVENGLKRDFFSPMDSTKLVQDLKKKILFVTDEVK